MTRIGADPPQHPDSFGFFLAIPSRLELTGHREWAFASRPVRRDSTYPSILVHWTPPPVPYRFRHRSLRNASGGQPRERPGYRTPRPPVTGHETSCPSMSSEEAPTPLRVCDADEKLS